MTLKKGDTVGLVAPASFVDLKKLQSAVDNLENMGFKVKLGESVKKKWFSFAGTDEERAKDINDFFGDKEVKAIICVRGGYGGTRLLELLDYDKIEKNPKIFVGYSDITTLLTVFYQKCGMKTYHGPMAVSNFSGDYSGQTLESFLKVLENNSSDIILENFGEPLKFYNEHSAEGILVGGNLAVLVSNLKTNYDIDYRDKILFLEDIGESSYRIDRMLWQLKNSGIFDEITGVILGDFDDCGKSLEEDMELQEVFDSHFSNFGKPVCYNLKSGHCTPMQTLEIGGILKIDGKKQQLILKRG